MSIFAAPFYFFRLFPEQENLVLPADKPTPLMFSAVSSSTACTEVKGNTLFTLILVILSVQAKPSVNFWIKTKITNLYILSVIFVMTDLTDVLQFSYMEHF